MSPEDERFYMAAMLLGKLRLVLPGLGLSVSPTEEIAEHMSEAILHLSKALELIEAEVAER